MCLYNNTVRLVASALYDVRKEFNIVALSMDASSSYAVLHLTEACFLFFIFMNTTFGFK